MVMDGHGRARLLSFQLLCRLESVRAVLANGIAEDPLESEEQLQEQMDSLPYMCRFQYEHAAELIVSRMDPIVAAYQKVLASQLTKKNVT